MTTSAVSNRQSTPMEDQAEAVAAIPKGLALIKIERETMTALAATHPRDMNQIKTGLEEILKAFPLLAEESIYNKPVGREEGGGQQKYARNLSIRAAEVLAEAYGYNESGTDLEILDEDHVKVTGTFIDYQRGRIVREASIVSRWFKMRTGMVRLAEDRFYNVNVKAEKSKTVREAILRCINAGLKAWFFDRCEKMVDQLLDDNTTQKMIGQFSTKGVGLEQLERHLGKPLRAGWTKQDRKDLLGIWNAVKDGESTIEEVFGQEQPKHSAKSNGGAQASDLTNPKKSNESLPPAAAPASGSPPAGGSEPAPPPGNMLPDGALPSANRGGGACAAPGQVVSSHANACAISPDTGAAPSTPLQSAAPNPGEAVSPPEAGAALLPPKQRKKRRADDPPAGRTLRTDLEGQFRRLGWNEEQVKACLREDYGVESVKGLSWDQAQELVNDLEACQ